MNATLTWNANSEGDLQKYTVYDGPSDGVYTRSQDVTPPTVTLTINGLADGVPWYFAITATDNASNESAKSSSVTKINKHVKVRSA